MRLAVAYAMALGLWRDRALFALTFLLPSAIFIIFAAVFSATTSGDLSIRLGVVAPDDDVSVELVSGLRSSDIVEQLIEVASTNDMQGALIADEFDVGIEISRLSEEEAPTFKIYFDPAKKGAATIAEAALAALAPPEVTASELISPAEKISIDGTSGGTPMAAYYAAGVGMLFLFLSGFQSALSVIEERDAGILERIAAGPYGLRPMIDGKFLFLIAQGVVQIFTILVVAAILFKVSLSQSPIQLLITTIAAAISASGIALGVVGCCRSRNQAHAVGAVLALVMGAIGGSMAPRFLMAPEVRAIGAFTPNAWGIEAFSVSIWRSGGLELLWVPWALLTASGIFGLLIAYNVMKHTLDAR